MKTNSRAINVFSRTASIVALNTVLFLGNCFIAQAKNDASNGSFPRLVKGQVNADCQLALKIAKLAFQTKAPKVFEAGDQVRAKDKSLVLWPSEDGGLNCDTNYFDCQEGGAAKKICVQKQAVNSAHFAVRQKEFNWQGDWFDLVLIKGNDDVAKINETLQGVDDLSEKEKIPANMQVVVPGAWQRPWLIRNGANNHIIAFDTQHPAEFMSDWDVYAPSKDGTKTLIGKIRFHPPGGSAVKVMPNGALKDFAVLLNQIIGVPKESEGTYNATGRVKLAAEQAWGNALYRPWAMEKPYNSRAIVDKGLKRWSKGSKVYKQQYEKLLELYPKAESELAQYYVAHLNRSEQAATKLATTSLDNVLRSHFVFSSAL